MGTKLRRLILAGLLTGSMVLSLTACGKDASDTGTDAAAESSQSQQEISLSADESESVSAEEEMSVDAAEEDTLSVEAEEIEPVTVIDMLSIAPGSIIEVDESQLDQYFQAYEIPDSVFQRINGRSYRENNDISLDDLRYMKIVHYNFNHETQVGEIIVNAALVDDYLHIFRELYDAEYEIQSMYLVDNYWTGDGTTSDSASIDANNTSAFCYRNATGSGTLSNHALGRAIDINPQQNPYVSFSGGSASWSHSNANDYIDRTTGYAHVITHDDICYQIFTKYGFSWGGDWSNPKDYQHFEKEY